MRRKMARARHLSKRHFTFFPSENKIFSNTKKHPNAKIVIFSKWRLAAVPRRWPGAALASLQRQENHFRLFFFFVLNQRRGEEEEEEERKAAIKTFFFFTHLSGKQTGQFSFRFGRRKRLIFFFPPPRHDRRIFRRKKIFSEFFGSPTGGTCWHWTRTARSSKRPIPDLGSTKFQVKNSQWYSNSINMQMLTFDVWRYVKHISSKSRGASINFIEINFASKNQNVHLKVSVIRGQGHTAGSEVAKVQLPQCTHRTHAHTHTHRGAVCGSRVGNKTENIWWL